MGRTPAYTTVDLDARVSLEWIGLNNKTFFQFNVQNVFNQYYVGGFSVVRRRNSPCCSFRSAARGRLSAR